MPRQCAVEKWTGHRLPPRRSPSEEKAPALHPLRAKYWRLVPGYPSRRGQQVVHMSRGGARDNLRRVCLSYRGFWVWIAAVLIIRTRHAWRDGNHRTNIRHHPSVMQIPDVLCTNPRRSM